MDRPETIAERMRVAAKYLSFYDSVSRTYTIPLLESHIIHLEEINRNGNLDQLIKDAFNILKILEDSVYPEESSYEIQNDIIDDSFVVEELQSFYNAIIESSLEHYSIAQEFVQKDYMENQ